MPVCCLTLQSCIVHTTVVYSSGLFFALVGLGVLQFKHMIVLCHEVLSYLIMIRLLSRCRHAAYPIADDPHFSRVKGVVNDPAYQELLFKTTACMREEQASCFVKDHPFYPITHRGVDAMVKRFMDEVRRRLCACMHTSGPQYVEVAQCMCCHCPALTVLLLMARIGGVPHFS